MTRINRTKVKDNIRDAIRGETNDFLPSESNNILQPVIDVNPIPSKAVTNVKSATRIATGSTNIYSAVSTQEQIYINTIILTLTADAAADNIGAYVQATINGATTTLLEIVKTTLTAHASTATISFPMPIKLDKGSNITLVLNTLTVGTAKAVGNVTFLKEE